LRRASRGRLAWRPFEASSQQRRLSRVAAARKCLGQRREDLLRPIPVEPAYAIDIDQTQDVERAEALILEGRLALVTPARLSGRPAAAPAIGR